jgi:hypothetical protein
MDTLSLSICDNVATFVKMSFALRAITLSVLTILVAAEPLNNLEARATTTSFALVHECHPDCEAYVSDRHWAWFPVSVTATVTHATIIYIIKSDGTTSTSTKFNELPSGMSPPPTNDVGTQTAKVPVETEVGKSTTINLAYPTELHAGAPSYQWQGTLPTVNAMGASTCSTNALLNGTGIPLEGFTVPVTKTVPDDFSTQTKDLGGMFYTLFPYACRVGTYLSSVPPGNADDGAIKYCATNQGVCGVSVVNTVQYLTETSTSTEKSKPSNAATTSKPPPTDAEATISPETEQQISTKQLPPTTSKGSTDTKAELDTPARTSTTTKTTEIVSTSNGQVVTRTTSEVVVFTPSPSPDSTSTDNIGDEIAGGLGLSTIGGRGPSAPDTASSAAVTFTGGASRSSSPLAVTGVAAIFFRLILDFFG